VNLNGVCKSYGTGLYVASETSAVTWGRMAVPGVPKGVITCQGSHGLSSTLFGTDTWDRAQTLAAAGYVNLSGDISQTLTQGTFGNDTAVTRVGQLKTFIQGSTAPMKAASGKVHLIGGSGGATDAINYARANPTLVASMYLIAPLVDVEDFYSNWLNGGANGATGSSGVTTAEINKAYNAGVDDGGTAYLAAMPSHNPIRSGNQAALSTIPMKLPYSDNDPFIPVSKVTAYADLVNAAGGNAVAYSQGAVGHSGTGVDPQDVVSFFRAHP
jgi:pimeloyl-ACP methyl ester carboxylesterase